MVSSVRAGLSVQQRLKQTPSLAACAKRQTGSDWMRPVAVHSRLGALRAIGSNVLIRASRSHSPVHARTLIPIFSPMSETSRFTLTWMKTAPPGNPVISMAPNIVVGGARQTRVQTSPAIPTANTKFDGTPSPVLAITAQGSR